MFSLSFVKGSKSAEGGPYPPADLDRGVHIRLRIWTGGSKSRGVQIRWDTIKLTPKQTILATDFQRILKEQFSFKFQDNLKIQNKYYVLKCENHTAQN